MNRRSPVCRKSRKAKNNPCFHLRQTAKPLEREDDFRAIRALTFPVKAKIPEGAEKSLNKESFYFPLPDGKPATAKARDEFAAGRNRKPPRRDFRAEIFEFRIDSFTAFETSEHTSFENC